MQTTEDLLTWMRIEVRLHLRPERTILHLPLLTHLLQTILLDLLLNAVHVQAVVNADVTTRTLQWRPLHG
jgi:hypothetical protein